MTSLHDIYQQMFQNISANETNLKFWENYLQQLKSLDFSEYSSKLKVPTLVPIGSRIMFRGELQHTNEVTVSLGANYFAKCSIAQAEILRQRRIKDAESKVEMYMKEKEFLENQLSFTKENVFVKNDHEILEVYSEQEDKAWREKHRENVRKYKQSKAKEMKQEAEISDAELWERLEELELQEELENDLSDNLNEIVDKRNENSFLQKEVALLHNTVMEENNNQKSKESNQETEKIKEIVSSNSDKIEATNEISKHNLLQKVLDKQAELENKLYELKNKDRDQSKSEQDLISRLDEIEQLEELEDEMDRLEDIIETEHVETDDSTDTIENSNKSETTLKKSISFADDNSDAETIEVEFTHSDNEPNNETYDSKKGISKPSDIYVAFAHLLDTKTTSILKKTKYGTGEVKIESRDDPMPLNKPRKVMFGQEQQVLESAETEERPAERIIVVKDVVESVGVNQHHIEGGARPTSLFKKRRMQKK